MKFKRIASAFLAFVMVGVNVFNGLVPALADTEDNTVQNPDPNRLEDGVVLHKTAKSVPGYANKWEVTLRIESPKTEKTSDTVIVIDRSGSMSDDNRLTNAKSAARSLAQQLLPEDNTTNRVAVVSFATTASNSGTGTSFTDDYNTVSTAIGRMSSNGGTNTQSAIHLAAEMLSGSTADIKTMILLSDGEPTYSIPFKSSAQNDNDNFTAYGTALETSSTVDQSAFNYEAAGRVGNGSDLRQCMQREWWGCAKYYNNGNSAIAEAGYFKASGDVTLYTIALDAGPVGTPILNAIASPDKHYTATPAELSRIFNEIGGSILTLVQNASVEDTMGQGVKVSVTGSDVLGPGLELDEDGNLDWIPEFKLEGDIFVAETSYIVEMNEDVYKQYPDDSEESRFYALNSKATLTYDGGGGEFPIPKAKPFSLRVEKDLVEVDENGNETTKSNEEFKFKISGSDKEYSVFSGSHNFIRVPMPIELGTEYAVTETGIGDSGSIAFEYYNDPEYTVKYNGVESSTNKFVVTADHGDEVDIKIKNRYEKTKVLASKTWEDDEDRDGLRKNYNDLYVVVKDGNSIVKMAKIANDKDATRQSFSFTDLPKNRNGVAINYTLAEARGCSESNDQISCTSEFTGDASYTVTVDAATGAIVNKHVPETTKLQIKKKWDVAAGSLPTVTPGFVEVEVSNDVNDVVETITLRGDAYTEWSGEFEGYKYEDGKEINYQIAEKRIGDNVLDSDKSALYIYEDGVLEGKWVASYNNAEVTNTWTPAKNVYAGSGEFYIKKLDQAGQPLPGVTFAIGNDSYTTGSDGSVKVEFLESSAKPEDKYAFNITESSAPDYYELISGTEVIEASTKLDYEADEESLTNTYTVSFDYSVKIPIDGYVWQADDKTVVVTNQALAKDLKIEKTFDGISSEAFEKESRISFDIEGPKGFEKMTVGISDKECGISGAKLVCTISGDDVLLPVGKYSVAEKNADITNFTYVSDPEDGKIVKTVELGQTATFTFKNIYKSVKTASYKVRKIWVDDEDRDGVRPDDLEVTLYADGEKYGSPIKLSADDGWSHEWTELPLVNENAEEIQYSVEEAKISDYESDGGVMDGDVFVFTNTHTPEPYNETGELLVEKTWFGEDNELMRPMTITIELYGEITNEDGERVTWMVGNPVEVSSANDWKWTFSGLYRYEDGKEIVYSVQESAIGDTDFGQDESTIVVYEDDGEVLKGKWEKSISDFEITNTWTPATNIYSGKDEFLIKKIDQDGNVMKGVTFKIASTSETTDSKGQIKVAVPEDEKTKQDNLEYKIKETKTLDGYDLVDGSATVKVTSTSVFQGADVENLVNIYEKSYTYEVDGDTGYSWGEESKTLTVVNNRSKAKSLVIKKTFSGVSESVLQDLTFTITGPEDFGDQGSLTLTFAKDCRVLDKVATCTVKEDVPTGDYKVVENGAEIENFTLTVTGDNDKEKEIKKDDEAIFEINNTYVVDKISYLVVKLWDDAHNKDEVRPEKLTINLLADGRIVKSQDLSEGHAVSENETTGDSDEYDVWAYEFGELPIADEDANVIDYKAEEIIESDEYEQTGASGDAYSMIFTNTHESKPEDPCVDGGGCGGVVPPAKPNTGKLTKFSGAGSADANNMIGGIGAIILLASSSTALWFVFVARRRAMLDKQR